MRLAVEHIRRMKGGSQSHLMRCDDGGYYVVKFQNNPQHRRILANELLATRLAARMGICVPQVAIVEVPSALIKCTSDLVMQTATGRIPCSSGRQFGSRFPAHPSESAVEDQISSEHFYRIENIDDFIGILVFDKWTCNTDNRQALFIRQPTIAGRGEHCNVFQVMMVDQGFCFNGGSWNFPDGPRYSLYPNRGVYRTVVGIESFGKWIDRLEQVFTPDVMVEEAERIPSEWLGGNRGEFRAMVGHLYVRRGRIRELLWSTRNAARDEFPNWNTYPCASPNSKEVGLERQKHIGLNIQRPRSARCA